MRFRLSIPSKSRVVTGCPVAGGRCVTDGLLPALFIVLSLSFLQPVIARDIIERPRAVLPGAKPDGFAVIPAIYGDLSYVSHAIQGGENDSFYIGQFLHAGLVDVGVHRIGLYYGTYLFTGPVDDPSRQGSDLAPWLMNAVQYEYGLTWRSSLGILDVVGEYGRRSFHPFRRQFAQPATDIIRGGAGVMALPLWGGELDLLFRLRWSRLFSFWGSAIPDPRSTWTIQPATEYRRLLGTVPSAFDFSVFASGGVDVLFLREGGVDWDGLGEVGLAIEGRRPEEGPRRRIESYLSAYRSGDTEEIIAAPYPVTLVGWGVRLVFEW